MNKMILHVDGDNFFASCEMSRFPHLWGKPVVVGQERGIACAMSIEAKKLGITRAMLIFKIRETYKDVVIMSSHFDLYEMYSNKLFNILSEYFDDVEHYSIDECFASASTDKNGINQCTEEYLRIVKKDVQKRLGITFSFGLAANKVLAKVASKHKKPDGLTIINSNDEDKYLESLSVGSLWGIGPRTAEKLRSMNIHTSLQFKNFDEGVVRDTFSDPVVHIHRELSCRASSQINTSHEDQKSIQSTRSFTPATTDFNYLHSELSQNIEDACERLRSTQMYGKFISVFIKTKITKSCPIVKYFSFSKELEFFSNNPVDILRAIRDDLPKIINPAYLYKATGVTINGLRHKEFIPDDLLGSQNQSFEINSYVDTIDAIQRRFGDQGIRVASSLQVFNKRRKEEQLRDTKDPYIWNLPLPYLGHVS
jgi:DNA polymerase-4/DNA polymerase V